MQPCVVDVTTYHVCHYYYATMSRTIFCRSDTESILTNKRAKRSDQGSYSIRLTNPVGYDTATCRVQVVDRPTAPQVSVRHSPGQVRSGQTAPQVSEAIPQVRSGQVRSGQTAPQVSVRHSQGQVRSGQVRSGQTVPQVIRIN